jgi:hypothetical protein
MGHVTFDCVVLILVVVAEHIQGGCLLDCMCHGVGSFD